MKKISEMEDDGKKDREWSCCEIGMPYRRYRKAIGTYLHTDYESPSATDVLALSLPKVRYICLLIRCNDTRLPTILAPKPNPGKAKW